MQKKTRETLTLLHENSVTDDLHDDVYFQAFREPLALCVPDKAKDHTS
jgi:hypothetical protein